MKFKQLFIDTHNSQLKQRAFTAMVQAAKDSNGALKIKGSWGNHTIDINNTGGLEAAQAVAQMYNVRLSVTTQQQNKYEPITYQVAGPLAVRNSFIEKLKSYSSPSFRMWGHIKKAGREHSLVYCKTLDHKEVFLSCAADFDVRIKRYS